MQIHEKNGEARPGPGEPASCPRKARGLGSLSLCRPFTRRPLTAPRSPRSPEVVVPTPLSRRSTRPPQPTGQALRPTTLLEGSSPPVVSGRAPRSPRLRGLPWAVSQLPDTPRVPGPPGVPSVVGGGRVGSGLHLLTVPSLSLQAGTHPRRKMAKPWEPLSLLPRRHWTNYL